MTNRNHVFILGLIYIAAAFFGFAVLRYLYVFEWIKNPEAADILVATRVLLSAPMLMICGILLLVIRRQKRTHLIFGTLFLVSGIIWAIMIINAILDEAA